jgi:hypothetical protein
MQQQKLGIIVPYRNRKTNLDVFIPYMNDYMKSNHPDINYKIYVIEQANKDLFNKGFLFNCGYMLTKDKYDYLALHDVDVLPISANYKYNEKALHLCANVYGQRRNGRLESIINEGVIHHGGVVLLTNSIYESTNGHSNEYLGWGGEDDDYSARLTFSGNPLIRHYYKTNDGNKMLGNYITLNHSALRFEKAPKFKENFQRFMDLKNGKINWKKEGLNTTNFDLVDKKYKTGYILYKVDYKK